MSNNKFLASSIACFLLSACNGGTASLLQPSNSQTAKTSGMISISPIMPENIYIGESATANIVLFSNQNVINPVLINISNYASNIVNISPEFCYLTSGRQICTVTITGLESGISSFTVSAVGYESQVSESIVVIITSPTPTPTPTISPVPGTLSISPITNTNVYIGESASANVVLVNSQNVVTPVLVKISSIDDNIISVSPESCNLTTATNSCLVTITGLESGVSNFTVEATGYESQLSEPVTVLTPLIFISTNLYSGDLQHGGGVYSITASSGESGADMLCNIEAESANLLGDFAAIIITESRSPCMEGGRCGESAFLDWHLQPGITYYNPDGTQFQTVNNYGVFVSAPYELQNLPGSVRITTIFWEGIQEILINESITDIIAWSYADQNPANDSSQYASNLRNCNNFTSNSSIVFGSTGNISGNGTTSFAINNPPTISGWGNYYTFYDGIGLYYQNLWNSEYQDCSQTISIVCASAIR